LTATVDAQSCEKIVGDISNSISLLSLIAFLVLVISICGYFMYTKYKQLQEREKQKFLELVERIIYHVQNAGAGGIAVPIIRDTIMEAARYFFENISLICLI
jgi:hypothetical protein